MLDDVNRAKIVITNYHAFKLRERIELSKGGRQLLQGRTGDELHTLETEGQMLQRVMPDLMGMKNILVINDEAHHCYREKPKDADDEDLKGDDRKEAEKNNEAARLWISGLEAVNRKLGLSRVIDLVCDAVLPARLRLCRRHLVPVDDERLLAHGCHRMRHRQAAARPRRRKHSRRRDADVPQSLGEHPQGHAEERARQRRGTRPAQTSRRACKPRCKLSTATTRRPSSSGRSRASRCRPASSSSARTPAISKLVYDFISGFHRKNDDGTTTLENGRLALFRNFDETTGNPLPRPNTLLIDSEQLEAGDALDDNFRGMAADEIERFRREIVERTGDARAGDNITDQELLREVMNTVGKPGQLGGAIRCVVSVSMLTEGWDANTVTHVLGIRAFGTQLLCEQVIGRALRRQSYELNEEGLFNVEYADVFGIPFDFTAKPVIAPPQPPRETVQVKAVRPERDALEIRFPRVEGYRVELPEERLTADFNDDSILVLSPDLVGPSITRNSGIIGEGVDMSLEHLGDMRPSTLVFHVTQRLLYTKWRDPGEEPKLHLFGQLKRITKQWLDTCLVCKGGTYPAQLMYQELADMACNRITAASPGSSSASGRSRRCSTPTIPPAPPRHVRFNTSKRRSLGDQWPAAEEPHQLGGARQRLGSRVLPRRRIASQGAGLHQEPQPRPRSAVSLRLRDAEVSS